MSRWMKETLADANFRRAFLKAALLSVFLAAFALATSHAAAAGDPPQRKIWTVPGTSDALKRPTQVIYDQGKWDPRNSIARKPSLIIFDRWLYKVLRLQADGQMSELAGTDHQRDVTKPQEIEGKKATEISLFSPRVSITRTGEILIADYSRIFKITTDGTVRTLITTETIPVDSAPCVISYIGDVAAGSAGDFFFAAKCKTADGKTDSGPPRVMHATGESKLQVKTVLGGGSQSVGKTTSGTQIRLDEALLPAVSPTRSGDALVGTHLNGDILRMSPNGDVLSVTRARPPYALGHDVHLMALVEGEGSAVYAGDNAGRVFRADGTGEPELIAGEVGERAITQFGGDGVMATTVTLDSVMSLAFESDGGLFIADATHQRIRYLDPLKEPEPVLTGSDLTLNRTQKLWESLVMMLGTTQLKGSGLALLPRDIRIVLSGMVAADYPRIWIQWLRAEMRKSAQPADEPLLVDEHNSDDETT